MRPALAILALAALLVGPARAQGSCTGVDAVTAFEAAGISVGNVVSYDEETDPNRLLGRRGGYVEKVAWSDGSVERFASTDDRDRRETTLAGFDGTILGDGYRYTAGLLLVRISREVTPSQARAYEAAVGASCVGDQLVYRASVQEEETRPLLYDPFGPDRDCGDFPTWQQAQDFYLAAGGPTEDPHRLDTDRDGIACENRPGSPVRRGR